MESEDTEALKSRSRIHDICCPDGSFASSNDEKVNIFNTFFASVFTADNGTVPHFPARVDGHVCLDSIDFSPATVYKTLKRLKSSTSVGPDGLPNVFLKQCSSALAVPLSHIFEISFKDNILPACWKEDHTGP